ncbi:hypothetical protein GCM10020221_29470 [Streptomyces thioluteus]|uniref:Uncharacterized protein n=2 Tax=Streptomyces TaxID=1883 RepID=A0A2N8NXC9_STREU|nr:hypothetical protein [Streptomyces eurocidicus]MBB5120464.1 hypothetical protein [Streptomyces eurocidicus]MBF6053677.1 hypothetical protein [Streptomyces eurocidicus]PNE33430.1 hypothetical protein AF335_11080 [Streptomyces eurocidicus]
MGRPNRAVQAAITQRRTDAVDLRVAGVGWPAIGRKLAADPSINADERAYPQGYGIDRYRQGLAPPSDKRLIELACRDVSKALKERAAELSRSTDELRQLMMKRLERLFFPMYQLAVRSGDYRATDRAVRIIERECRLLGLDQPVRTELSGPSDTPVQAGVGSLDELGRLIGLAGDLSVDGASMADGGAEDPIQNPCRCRSQWLSP